MGFTEAILGHKVVLYLLVASIQGYKISQDRGERGLQTIDIVETSHSPRFALAIHFSEFYTLVVAYLLVNTGAYL